MHGAVRIYFSVDLCNHSKPFGGLTLHCIRSYVAELPDTLDSLFHQLINATNTSIGVVGSHKVARVSIQ